MKKILSILLAAVLAFGLTACAKDSEPPVIEGVVDSAQIAQGESFNALENVTAKDDKDGDITDKIALSSEPNLEFKDGVATPPSPGTYEIIYSVKDKAGNEGNAYTTLTVTRSINKEESYKKYVFDDAAAEDISTFGFAAETANGAAAELKKEEGVLRLDVKNAGADAGDVMLNKREFKTVPGTDYEISVWMKSNVPFMFHYIANDTAKGWLPLGNSAWNVNVGTSYAEYSLIFTAPAEENANVEILMQMGKFALQDAVNPDAFVLDVLKVEVTESTGTETEKSVYASNYAENLNGFEVVKVSDKAAAEAKQEGGNAAVSVEAYPDAGYELRMLQSIGTPIEKDKKYKATIEVTAENTQNTEIVVESKKQEHNARAFYYGVKTLNAGEKTTIEFTFVSGADIADDAVVRMDIGTKSEGVTTNKITVSKIEFFAVEGDKTSEFSLHRFIPYNEETEWNCFNGSDDATLDAGGLGTMYAKDGKLYYKIEEISSLDYGNKIFVNKIHLEAGGLYKIKFTMKADRDVKCWFILNKYKDYDPRISEVFDLGAEAKTFEFTTSQEIVIGTDFELVFSFGATYNEAGAHPVLIEFSDVEIFKLT